MTNKKKVFHLIQSLGNGGCENMLLRTLPLLSDFEHTIITLKEPGELAPKFLSAGIRVETIRSRQILHPAGILRLRKFILNTSPDIVITYLFHADFLGRLALLGTTNATVIPFLRTTYNHPRYWIARLFEWLTKPLVRHYLANSEAVKDFYIRHIGVASERITVIPNGIDTAYFDQLAPDLELRAALSLSPDDFVIICVANLHPNKGHRFLLEAFESLRLEFPKTKLLLIGDGEERENIEAMTRALHSKDAIRLLGRRNDVPALLKLSDLFVLPTLFEGQSNAILEAMAADVPVITTDIPENRCIIKDSITGLLVPKNDSAAIAGALRKLLSDTTFRKSLTDNAHDTIRDHHSLSSIRESWTTFLRAL
ncbi:MAG: glycosyltransferase [Undibacterium sp.]